MHNLLNVRDLFPSLSDLELLAVEKAGQAWVVRAEGRAFSHCPLCGVKSISRHSRYWRRIVDLPIQGSPVILHLRMSRWRCRNRSCSRRIFAERLEGLIAPLARRTKRVTEI